MFVVFVVCCENEILTMMVKFVQYIVIQQSCNMIWILNLSLCHCSHSVRHCRDWFNPPPTTIQLLTHELLVEQTLRRQSEERLTAALQAQRAAERERDMFRVSGRVQCVVM